MTGSCLPTRRGTRPRAPGEEPNELRTKDPRRVFQTWSVVLGRLTGPLSLVHLVCQPVVRLDLRSPAPSSSRSSQPAPGSRRYASQFVSISPLRHVSVPAKPLGSSRPSVFAKVGGLSFIAWLLVKAVRVPEREARSRHRLSRAPHERHTMSHEPQGEAA